MKRAPRTRSASQPGPLTEHLRMACGDNKQRLISGDDATVAEAIDRWFELAPDDPSARHLRAAVRGETTVSASVVGAPKVRTAELIRDLEPGPRGIYTGAVGYVGPGRKARFNVAIRTATIDRESKRATYGTGSGIVWDSRPGREFRECAEKTRVLTAGVQPFQRDADQRRIRSRITFMVAPPRVPQSRIRGLPGDASIVPFRARGCQRSSEP